MTQWFVEDDDDDYGGPIEERILSTAIRAQVTGGHPAFVRVGNNGFIEMARRFGIKLAASMDEDPPDRFRIMTSAGMLTIKSDSTMRPHDAVLEDVEHVELPYSPTQDEYKKHERFVDDLVKYTIKDRPYLSCGPFVIWSDGFFTRIRSRHFGCYFVFEPHTVPDLMVALDWAQERLR